MSFQLESPNATLENLNLRAELNGEEYVPAVDLKIKCEADDKMAGYLMGSLEKDHIPPLWRNDNDHREKMYYGIQGGISSSAAFEDCEVEFKNVTIRGAKVNKFVIEPISGGKINLTLRVQFRPSDKQLAALSHHQKKGGKFKVTSSGQFFPTDDDQTDLDL